jgi:hypothetical protein
VGVMGARPAKQPFSDAPIVAAIHRRDAPALVRTPESLRFDARLATVRHGIHPTARVPPRRFSRNATRHIADCGARYASSSARSAYRATNRLTLRANTRPQIRTVSAIARGPSWTRCIKSSLA